MLKKTPLNALHVITSYSIHYTKLYDTTMFFYQRRIFRRYGLHIRKNTLGLLLYMLSYQLIMAPASLSGYLSELFNTRKRNNFV